MNILISFILGTLFSIGLSVSGMVNPDKVLGYLDFFGKWDPSLVFVMGGGVTLNIVLFHFILKRWTPLLDPDFSVPTNKTVDKKLILGSALFGIGWGIGGVCPGPGLANLFLLDSGVIAFLISMIIGMLLFKFLERKL